MPTYEYICRACGHEFEEFQSIKADPIAVCPKCRKKKVERKISGGGAVIFKGGGFYETDYRSDSYRSGADADKKADGETEGKGSGDSKAPAASKVGGKVDGAREPGPAEKPAAKADPAPATKSDAKSHPKSDARSDARSDAKSDAKSDASIAENKRIEARATHRSRIGRGVGNIVKSKPSPKSAQKRPKR
jgi:putative FmdB family regulatory protein